MNATPSYAPGLRHAAAALQARVDVIASVTNQLTGAVSGMTFAGPAADRFRASIQQVRGDLLALNANLRDLIDSLLRAAAAEEAQPGWLESTR